MAPLPVHVILQGQGAPFFPPMHVVWHSSFQAYSFTEKKHCLAAGYTQSPQSLPGV